MGHYAHHIWFDHHIHGWILVGGGGCVTMLYIVNYLFALWTHLLCIVLSYWNYNVKIVVGVSHLWCPVHWCPHSYDICGIFTCKKVQTSSFLLHCLSITLVHIVTCQAKRPYSLHEELTDEGLPCSIYGTNTDKYQTFTIDGVVEVLKPPLRAIFDSP